LSASSRIAICCASPETCKKLVELIASHVLASSVISQSSSAYPHPKTTSATLLRVLRRLILIHGEKFCAVMKDKKEYVLPTKKVRSNATAHDGLQGDRADELMLMQYKWERHQREE
jgi:hypothetical protein